MAFLFNYPALKITRIRKNISASNKITGPGVGGATPRGDVPSARARVVVARGSAELGGGGDGAASRVRLTTVQNGDVEAERSQRLRIGIRAVKERACG